MCSFDGYQDFYKNITQRYSILQNMLQCPVCLTWAPTFRPHAKTNDKTRWKTYI